MNKSFYSFSSKYSTYSRTAPSPPHLLRIWILGICFIISTASLGHALNFSADNNFKSLTSSPINPIELMSTLLSLQNLLIN